MIAHQSRSFVIYEPMGSLNRYLSLSCVYKKLYFQDSEVSDRLICDMHFDKLVVNWKQDKFHHLKLQLRKGKYVTVCEIPLAHQDEPRPRTGRTLSKVCLMQTHFHRCKLLSGRGAVLSTD